MTVVGSDNFADAPTLTVGTSSAYTPNAGYTTEVGEPTAWGGKTAWWKVIPAVDEFHYIDVLWSTGLTRAWVYRQDGSGFGGLLLVNDPGAGNQGGWNANAGSTYYIRLDSDGSDVSYVASVGMQVYDEIIERFPLTGASFGDPHDIVEDYFVPTPSISGGDPFEAVYYGIAADAVSGSPGLTEFGTYAEIQSGQFASEVTEEFPAYNGGLSWYGDPPDETYGHPVIQFGVTSDGASETITEPTDYSHGASQLVVVMSASDGPPMYVDPGPSLESPVPQIRMDGAFTTPQPVKYVDRSGTPFGTEVDVLSVLTEFLFRPPSGLTNPTLDYNNGTLSVTIVPNDEGSGPSDPQPAPVGVWRISYVGIQVIWQSDDPLPYEPPPPPIVLSVVRQYPATSSLAWGGSGRIYPPDKAQRTIGGQQ